MAVLVERSTEPPVETRGRRWGTDVQGTHCREGETGHDIRCKELQRRLQNSQTVSMKLQ